MLQLSCKIISVLPILIEILFVLWDGSKTRNLLYIQRIMIILQRFCIYSTFRIIICSYYIHWTHSRSIWSAFWITIIYWTTLGYICDGANCWHFRLYCCSLLLLYFCGANCILHTLVAHHVIKKVITIWLIKTLHYPSAITTIAFYICSTIVIVLFDFFKNLLVFIMFILKFFSIVHKQILLWSWLVIICTRYFF